MKFCKDCKHAAIPNALVQAYSQSVVWPMCGHPDAPREVIYGRLSLTCEEARGAQIAGPNGRTSICYPNAKLFEQVPPPVQIYVDPFPYATEEEFVASMKGPSLIKKIWRRIFG